MPISRDINPRKPNRWLIMPKAHLPGSHPLHLMPKKERDRLWYFAIAEAKKHFAEGEWGDLQTHNNASPYGAFDMAGNVMEWCQDWYSRDYYSVSPRKNPQGPATGAYRVLRGGTFFMEGFDLRSSARTAALGIASINMIKIMPIYFFTIQKICLRSFSYIISNCLSN